MSYRHTLEAAIESLHEIEDLIRTFPEEGKIPAIDLDLSLQKIRNLYELLIMLNKSDHPVQPVAHKPQPPVADLPEPKTEPKPVPVPEPKTVSEPVPAPETAVREPKPVEATPSPASREAADEKILSDRFRGRTTLHETLHRNVAKDGATLGQAKPVTSLMSAIGINDRFTFVRELFGNDTAFFEHTIQILNDASSFNDAYNYMITNHDWDMDSEPVQLLLEMIRRKFITGRHE
jgi:hypothetical protein